MGNEKEKAIVNQNERQIEEKVIKQHEEKNYERHYEIFEYVRDRKPRYTVESNGSKDIDILRMTGVDQSENKKE